MSNYTQKVERQDITGYSDDELSLQVFNTEYLYLRRHQSNFVDWLNAVFIFTPAQLDTLVQDLADELNEES